MRAHFAAPNTAKASEPDAPLGALLKRPADIKSDPPLRDPPPLIFVLSICQTPPSETPPFDL